MVDCWKTVIIPRRQRKIKYQEISNKYLTNVTPINQPPLP